MPFKSEAQRRYMWAKHPKIAKAWSHGKSSVTGKKEGKAKNKNLPMHVKGKKKFNAGAYERARKAHYKLK